ncbi:acyl dehydratase [Rhodococcus sp. 06-156-3C]|uniref:FAS1-like dehydratase domain-containing protein n=1 Tax=Nocardiaceae TaxID=85025 RepID=UPI000523033E|nr:MULTISPECIES: MaoC family dehydratase N-terminal domain-containing protein [Rhodococcus]OZD13119.1 acyl dehydratase [Rhodococcus sp. 06-156-4a]OZD17988.1 acyl dehydratase [Rhodococcus sp. 06-156-3C]OZD20712.1 acyl dehydratase [Rhodococcus sp. 06-156-4C]OZD30568.1 acyl dehydratase [Rhodococcus sp. 06-156-3b]OZD32658.1 acyl dehydratase [Rhodococcus sp. 06-156-3]
MTTTENGIGRELARASFTDEMLADMRALIGTELRTAGSINNEYATRLAILRFAEGIGDDNPLWSDEEYAAKSVHGGIIAPPSFIFACLGSVQVGWRGLGGFHAETNMTFHHPIKVGDKITATVVFDGFDGPTEASQFAGRRIKDYLRQEYRNQDGELVATFICSRMRFERSEMQAKRESRKIELPHPWTDEQLAEIDASVLAERPRGAETRYWDDVSVGDDLDVITKGPIGLTDEIAFIASGAAPIPRLAAHGVALRRYRKHPKWAFRDPNTNALEPVYSVHYNDYAASLQGAQAAYDVGIQRTCWQIHHLTNWIGDEGFIKSLHDQYRSHVYLSDVVRLGGRVTEKLVDEDGDHVVKVETWATNQRDQSVMPGSATIRLPHRADGTGASAR